MADIPVHAGGPRVSTVHQKSLHHTTKTVEPHTAETSGGQSIGHTKSVSDLQSDPAGHSSDPHKSKQVTHSQSKAAGAILHGEHKTAGGHGASQTHGGHGETTAHGAGHGPASAHGAGHGPADAHGGGHGGGHAPDPVEKGGQKAFEAADYANTALHNTGHALAHGKGHHGSGHGPGQAHGSGHGPSQTHGTGHADPHGPKPTTSEPAAHAPEVKPQAPATTTPPTTTEPKVTVREAHGEMAEMVENMKRNGAPIPEPTAPVKPKVQPTGEMAEYVEGIKAAQERDAAAIAEMKRAKAPAAPVKAAGASEVVAETVAHGAEGAGRAAKVGGAMMKAATVAEGVLGPLGIYYGNKELQHGLHEMHAAKDAVGVYDGATKVGLGAGTMVVGAAGTAGFAGAGTVAALGGKAAVQVAGSAAARIAGGVQVLGKVSAVAGGAVAVIDGANDIVHGVMKDEHGNRDLARAGRGGLKVAAGAMMIAGGPVGVAAGAALYAGVTIYENRKEIAAFAGHVADKVSEGASYLKEKTVAAVSATADKAVSVVKDVGGGIANAASSAWKAATSWW